MPKGLNLKNFGRRKSSGNALDLEPPPQAAPASGQSSFRVLERPEKRTSTSHGAQDRISGRTFDSPLTSLRGKSVDNLGLGPNRSVQHNSAASPGWPLNEARGSGGTTNSGSSGYYDSSSASARHSSTSTLPSSLDQEELYPVQKSATTGMYQTLAPSAHEPPPPPPSFSTRAARALSFGKNGNKASKEDVPPPVPAHYVPNGYPISPARSHSPQKERERAMTTSSYASTAVPPKTELTLNSTDFGNDDFGSMFDTLKKENPLPPPPTAGGFHRTDSQPMYPPRTYSRQAITPSPNALRREQSDSPYLSDDRSSNEALMSNSAMSSPNIPDGTTPEPAIGNGITKAFFGNAKSGYSVVPERYNSPGPERAERASIDSYSSAMDDEKETAFPHRQNQVDDEDRWVRRVELRDPQGPTSSSPARAGPSTRQPMGMQASAGASRPGAISPNSSTGDSYDRAESSNTTPRAARSELRNVAEPSLFDSSPAGPPSRAVRPIHERSESGTTKKMTKAQFQYLQKRGENSGEQSEEEDLSDQEYDDEDDAERAKKMASQRRKQEANMSVYRQQMKKVTGGGPTDLPSSAASTVRPSMDRGSSAPAAAGGVFHFGGIGGTPPADTVKGTVNDDEDDDVPLGILQAHGFPSSSRPPTRMGENDISHQRRTSVAGSVVGGGAGQGNLPPFARRLPADPYFGAGLVNQSTRESLAMNSSSASVYGMPTGPTTPQGHPGGLVGVIAGEERARAARRGSPNPATGAYGTSYNMPLPANMNPGMPRTMSMGNVMPPQMFAGAPPMPQMPQMMGMPQMPQMPQGMMDPAQQQMAQFMQMQMQFMQNMMAMQQAQMGQGSPQTPGQQQPQQVNDYLGVNFNNLQRPMSMASQTSGFGAPNGGRAMTMMNPPSGWAQGQASQNSLRPTSAMPMGGSTYAPSVSGLNISGGGPGPGYTPSIAPSERSNVGMPTRYRPVTQNGEDGRSQSMTSSMTLQAFAKQQTSPNLPGTPFNGTQAQTPKPTIRVVDKPKGVLKTSSRQVDEDDDEAWADMKKKREEKKKSKWTLGRKDKTSSTATTSEPSLSELYKGLD